MRRRASFDIPLQRDATGRFLPWIIALMVYLATLALAVALMLSGLASRWDAGLSGTLAVQINPLPGGDAVELQKRVDTVMAVMAGMPAIRDAHPLSPAESAALLEPWLGQGALIAELPIPALIDVRLAPGTVVKPLADRLQAAAPGVRIEEPGSWLRDLQALATTVQWVAVLVVVLIGGAAVASVIFAAGAGFAVHRSEVELLHVIGASDRYVAAQFQRHVVRLTAAGALAGLLLSLLTLTAVQLAAGQLNTAMLPALELRPRDWGLLPGVALAALLLAAVTARITVMRALGRMP